MAKPKPPTFAMTRLRSMISKARLACRQPNSAPEIKNKMMMPGSFLREIERDDGVRRLLLARGLEHELAVFLKGNRDDELDEGRVASESQIALFPENARDLVRRIDRSRVYVPSRTEYVELEPGKISRGEAKEAGEYLIEKGFETIRVGRELVELAKLTW